MDDYLMPQVEESPEMEKGGITTASFINVDGTVLQMRFPNFHMALEFCQCQNVGEENKRKESISVV